MTVGDGLLFMRLVVLQEDWRTKVYKVKHESDLDPDEWELIRNQVLVRDKMTCLRCDKNFRAKRELTVHHMIPRIDGGSNDLNNLVSLCTTCHDFVEIENLRTKADIIGSYDLGEVPGVEVSDKPPTKGVREDSFQRPAWHARVYGGRKD